MCSCDPAAPNQSAMLRTRSVLIGGGSSVNCTQGTTRLSWRAKALDVVDEVVHVGVRNDQDRHRSMRPNCDLQHHSVIAQVQVNEPRRVRVRRQIRIIGDRVALGTISTRVSQTFVCVWRVYVLRKTTLSYPSYPPDGRYWQTTTALRSQRAIPQPTSVVLPQTTCTYNGNSTGLRGSYSLISSYH